MRHDASRARKDAKSEQIRLNNGWLTPVEIQEKAEAEERRQMEQARKDTLGQLLLEDES